MRIRHLALSLGMCLGCQGMSARPELAEPESPKIVSLDSSAVAQTNLVRATPTTTEDSLSLAAACVEKGDSAGAAEYLKQHIRQCPEQIMIRAYLAELLFKMKNLPSARDQFERFIADAQAVEGPARQHMLHCHTRLMEIAQARSDIYEEHLHRGIGMLLLARQLQALTSREQPETALRERMLCKAAAELTAAKRLRPDEPRPYWYLAEAWTNLEQPRSAEMALKQAKARASLMPLFPAEQNALVVGR